MTGKLPGYICIVFKYIVKLSEMRFRQEKLSIFGTEKQYVHAFRSALDKVRHAHGICK